MTALSEVPISCAILDPSSSMHITRETVHFLVHQMCYMACDFFYTRTSFFSKKMAPQSGARFRAQTLSNHLQLGRKSLRGPEKWAHFWGQILATKVWPFVLAKIGAAGAKKTPQPHDFLTTKSLETNPFQTHWPNSTCRTGWRPTVSISAISLASIRIY